MDDKIYNERVQTAIATLERELPTLFEKDISYGIYTRDIFFQDPVNTFKYKFNYRIIFWTLRFHARLFFSEIYFDVHNIRHSQRAIVEVDWTVRGRLRLPWKADLFFNGTSTYCFNEDARIYSHRDTWDRSPQAILRQFLPLRVKRDRDDSPAPSETPE